jgi:ABC-type sugar transport system ATPase subunit
MPLLKVMEISRQGEGNFALNNISFSQKKFQKIAIAGETGSGKSTLMKIIAGLEQPDKGEVWFENQKVKGPAEKLVPGHTAIAYLSQDFELPKFLRVEQALEYSNTLSDEEANILFQVCQIDHLLKRKTNQLSGGERQRIAMARLLISSPRLLLLDEPFTHLDMVHKNTLKSVIRDIGDRLKITCILVSHDPEDTLSWSDKMLVMKDGRVVQKGPPEKIYMSPANEYVAGLFGKYNLIPASQSKTFCELFGLKPKRKNMFLRPEGFRVSDKGKRSRQGKVREVNFLGSHYELEIEFSDHILIINTDRNYKKGKKVFISIVTS